MAAMPNVVHTHKYTRATPTPPRTHTPKPCSKRRDAAVARCSNHLARSSSTTDAAAGGTSCSRDSNTRRQLVLTRLTTRRSSTGKARARRTVTTHAALGLGAAKRSLDRALAPYDGLWSRVLPMTLLFGVMSFCNCILDATKDTLVVTAFGGAEQIPWLTVWAVLPLSIVVLAVYSVASQRMFGRGLFYVSLAPFVAFFAVFTFVLYPNHASLHPHALITQLTATLPPGLTGLLAIIDNWTYTLFYAFAELWGDVVLSLLFWAYANDTTTLEDAALVYPLFGIGANIAQYVGGVLLCFVRTAVPVTATRSADAAWDIQLRILMSCVLVGSAVLCGIYEFTRKRNKADEMERVKSESRELEEKSSKPAVSLGESLGMLVRSPQIQCLTVMALAQGITANVFQVAWKGQMRDIFPLPADYSAFMGVVSTWQAVVTCICMLGAPYIFRKWGWAKTTALTPWVILWAGGAWMAASAWLPGVTSSMMGVPMLSILCMAGAAVYVFEKATKFSVFKPAEEMVYIGLDENAKTRGKASVDILGGQLGKSGGSVLIQGLLLCSTTGHLAGALPVLFTVHTIVAGMWIAAVSALAFHHGDLLDALTSVDDDDKDTADLVCDLQQPA